MRRIQYVFGVVLFFVASSSLHAQTNAAFMNRILNARFVMVTTENGDPYDPKVITNDRSAAGDVQNKIIDWKRFTLVYRQQDADIVIAVRGGGRLRTNAGIHIDTGREPNGSRLPGTYEPNQRSTSVGPIVEADAGPKDDLFSVYDAHDYPTSAVLWRREQKNGLGYPTLPLFEQFKKEVEKAASKKKP